MQLWPFKKRQPEKLSATELRDRLVGAVENQAKLRTLCEQHREQIVANLDLMGKVPEGIRENPAAVEQHVQALTAIAQCLANECGAPELWDHLTGSEETNPLRQWSQWFEQLPERKERLEYALLIEEARDLLEKSRAFQGAAARQNEILLQGQLADLLFHSGRGSDAIEAFRSALKMCTKANDIEGQKVFLSNLLEVYRHVGETSEAVNAGESLLQLMGDDDRDRGPLMKRIERIRKGEPLCWINCQHHGEILELDEITSIGDGNYEFNYCRNRLTLHLVEALVKQGNELGSTGKLKEALEKYEQARSIDPLDPDPVYQSGVGLLELGEYGKARLAFDEVERLAPGWFRCRSDQWLSQGLIDGTISDKEFRMLRVMEDGNLPADQIIAGMLQFLEVYPDFAPLYLILGDAYAEQNNLSNASLCYRKGLELVAEPDLESRLLCALAAILPKESPQRIEFFERVINLNGSLVATATARLMRLPSSHA